VKARVRVFREKNGGEERRERSGEEE